ncbi:MAG: amidohydrolase [Desulfobacteraceae bacterium]|jgi:5-methylthioadenosine/S-adenosylhomocysteine deaminase
MARPNSTQNPAKGPSKGDPDIIIEGGVLISMADGQAPMDPARIWVNGERISHIEEADNELEYHGNAEIIDARNCIIMPGLVNAHSHTAMTLFRGLADDLPLKEWLFDKIFPAESKHLRPETVYWGSLLGCLEMIASGTTSVIDGYFFQDETVRAIHQSGLRGLIAQGVIDFPAPGVPNPEDNLAVAEEFIKRWLGYSDLIKPGMFCHSPLTCSDKTLKRAMGISRDFSLPLQIHLSETSEEVREIVNRTDKRPVHYLDRLNILNERLIAAHAIHLSDDEMERLADRGVKVVHVPESNMKLSSGAARVSDMVRLGLTVGLGTDGCASNNNLDLFQEMDSAAKLGKVSTLNPVNMDAITVVKMVTSWGASLLGLEKEIGTLEVDKKADIIVVDLQSPHLVPLYNPLSAIVYSASGADVKDVIVNGRVLLKDRTFCTLAPEEIIERVTAFGREIAG